MKTYPVNVNGAAFTVDAPSPFTALVTASGFVHALQRQTGRPWFVGLNDDGVIVATPYTAPASTGHVHRINKSESIPTPTPEWDEFPCSPTEYEEYHR